MNPRAFILLALASAAAAAETAAPAPPDATAIARAPEAARADLQAASAAVAAGDAQRAVDKLRAARADAALPADLARTVERLQDALAERLAADNLSQAQDQERAGKWPYAERFLLTALASRRRAADELRALWARPEAAAALGAAAATQTEAALASGHGPDALRWRLARHRAEASLATPPAIDDLAALAAAAGTQDADLATLLRAAMDQVERQPGVAESGGGVALVERAATLARASFGDDDAQAARLAALAARDSRAAGIHALGAHELELGVSLELGILRLRARTSSAATPATTSGGFATADAGDSAAANARGERIAVSLVRAAPPGSGRVEGVLGGALTASAFQATVDVPISDAGVGASNLTGLSYHGAYGAQGVGLEAIGGARIDLDHGGGRWCLSALGTLGAEAMRTSLGTRPDAAGGSAAATTVHGAGIGVHAGLEADLAMRPAVSWQAELGLGLGWERLPGASGTGSATFINSGGTATTAGAESTSVHGVDAVGVWLRLGIARCW